MQIQYLLMQLKLAIYRCIRPLLFLLDPEKAHHISLSILNIIGKILTKRKLRPTQEITDCKLQMPIVTLPIIHTNSKLNLKTTEKKLMGFNFPNPVGLAAGLDKDGKYLDGLSMLNCGFIEVGTVTPKAQLGNNKPRLIRIPEFNALINRMGFNNLGVETLVQNIKKTRYQGILGVNIGKNAKTPIESAITDYLICLEKVYPIADYIAINISSPNTSNLRVLQKQKQLDQLLRSIKEKREDLSKKFNKIKPLAIKLSPDLDKTELESAAEVISFHQIEAVISSNTTTNHYAIKTSRFNNIKGGLSGMPNFKSSLQRIEELRHLLGDKITLIGVGGIFSGVQSKQMLDAGANLIQLYTGLIYRGPGLIDECIQVLSREQKAYKF